MQERVQYRNTEAPAPGSFMRPKIKNSTSSTALADTARRDVDRILRDASPATMADIGVAIEALMQVIGDALSERDRRIDSLEVRCAALEAQKFVRAVRDAKGMIVGAERVARLEE